MMLTQREHLDVLDNDKFIMVLMEDRPIDQISHVLLVTFGEIEHSLGVSLGGFAQTFSLRILSNALQDRPHSSGQFLNPLFRLFGGGLQTSPGTGACGASVRRYRPNGDSYITYKASSAHQSQLVGIECRGLPVD